MEKNFKPIEGLRGYLALWVAAGHAMQLAGYLDPPGPLKLIMQGDTAVQVFMIVSGFVITQLLLSKDEGYVKYLTRRFFRLYPCFVVCCAIGFLILPLWAAFVQSHDWAAGGWPAYRANVVALNEQSHGNFWPHFLLHATMLHGLVPEQVLPKAPMTFLPAAWSISLEWQFYLLAPLALTVARTPARAAVTIAACVVASLAYKRGYFGDFPVASHLAGNIAIFGVGILSRLALPKLRTVSGAAPVLAMFAAAAAILLFKASLAFVVWLPFYCYLVWGQPRTASERLFNVLFASGPVVLVGSISFSIYLLHRPLQVIGLTLADLAPGELSQPAALATQLVATAVSIPLAWLMYRYVEKPGIAFGRRLVAGPDPKPVQATS
jgi:peptidoglycan/LPS O-acetylase OafA/YrhL